MLRNDAAIARLAEVTATAGRVKSADGDPLRVADFMPWAGKEEPEPTVDSSIDGVLSAFGVKKHG